MSSPSTSYGHRKRLRERFTKAGLKGFHEYEIIEKSVYSSAKEVFDYLYQSMRDLKREVFKVI